VHRDLKPENVFVTPGPGVGLDKILDFGLAKSVVREREARLTATGIVLGTPGYLAPEQVRNVGLGPATDQYALALIAAELLTGRKVRHGVPIGEIIFTEVQRPMPRERLAGGAVSEATIAALVRATQPLPGDRFPDLGGFVRAFEGDGIC
jgi:serine/threonine protein kinase